MISQRMRHLVACVMLVLVARTAPTAATQLPFDSRPLIEVHTLAAVPKEVIALLGWEKREGPDGISGVVEGCPCEEGAFCSDQVWVVPKYDPTISGVLLSKINGHWAVGSVQQWWMDRAKLEANTQLTSNQRSEALNSFWEQFPACAR